MCGIAGFFGPTFDSSEFPAVICNMLRRVSYRGPDQSGYFFDEKAAIGAVRLSIIDLNTGSQPMCDPTGRHWIAYNGEVYNFNELRKELLDIGYRFRTQSDTEVVLLAYLAWGTRAFAKYNGGFSLAIYDREAKELVVARDRFGKRPLFYAQKDRTFLFASELKGLIDFPGFTFEWERESLASIFSLWTPLPEQTGFKGVHQLPLAGYLLINEQGLSVNTYSTSISRGEPFAGTEEQAAERVRSLLQESVRLRLQSDVAVGVYLSGGIDSAIVARLATDVSTAPLKTFSIAFTDPAFDETPYQEELKGFLGTQHTTLRISHDDIARDFPAAVMHAEVPIFRTAPVPLYSLSSLVRDHGIKVVLTGEGSDEAFLGYDIFKETYLLSQWNGLEEDDKDKLLGKLYPYLSHYNSDNFKAIKANYSRYADQGELAYWGHSIRFNSSNFVVRFLDKEAKPDQFMSAYVRNHAGLFESLSPIEQTQWIEFQTLLPGYLLSTQGDRMSLSHSVENRCPFLDPNLLAFALSLPLDYRLKNGHLEKHILKTAFRDRLPESVISRFKQPYLAPNAQVFFGATRPDYVESILSEQELRKITVLDHDLSLRFFNKLVGSDPSKLAPREHQAFVFLLSLSLLDRYFVQRDDSLLSCAPSPANLTVEIDGRGSFVNPSSLPSSVGAV